MTALRTWAVVGGIAAVITWGWYAAERLASTWERRAAERRFVAQRLRGERP